MPEEVGVARDTDTFCPIKQVWVVELCNELDEEDTEMADLTCTMEDCTGQLQSLTGRLSKYLDGMEMCMDEHYNYIAAYLGGLQKQSIAALTAVQIFIDQYWDKSDHAMNMGSWMAMEGIWGTGLETKQMQEVLGGKEGKTGIEKDVCW